MIITISGKAGSGKSTVGKIVAEKLGLEFYCIGDIRRKMAAERGMTLAEFNKLGEKEDFTDKEVDEYQRKLGKEKDNIIVVGRTSFHFIPHSFKVFLDVELDEAARRIMNAGRKDEHYKSIEEAKRILQGRAESDSKRYKKYYKLNVFDKKNYDLVIDTTQITAEQAAQRIIRKVTTGK